MIQLSLKISKELRIAFGTKCAQDRLTKSGGATAAIAASVKENVTPGIAPPEDGLRWAVNVADETAHALRVHAARHDTTIGEAFHTAIFNWTHDL